MKKKIQDIDFIEYINTFDSVNLIETWASSVDEFKVNGFTETGTCIPRNKSKGRYPGGLLCLNKVELDSSITMCQLKLSNSIGFRFKEYDLDVCIISIYNPPQSSKYVNSNFYEELSEEIANLNIKYPSSGIIIMGDFNARIGNENITFGKNTDTLLDEDLRTGFRKSRDKISNSQGKILLNFCDCFNLEILNGKYGQDKTCGNFTFLNENGASVIDFVLCSQDILPLIKDFYVGVSLKSHHMPIVLEIKRKHQPLDRYWLRKPGTIIRKYRWSTGNEKEFADRLVVKNDMDRFRQCLDIGDSEGAVMAITDTLREAGREMEVKHKSVNNRKHIKTGWYNPDCKALKSQTVKALKEFQRNGSELLHTQYNMLRVRYKRLLVDTKIEWQKVTAAKLKTTLEGRDQKQIWIEIRKINPSQKEENDIAANVWEKHFKDVFSGSTAWNGPTMPTLVGAFVTGLDEAITTNEIILALKSLKYGKAVGMDGIPSEFLKGIEFNKELLGETTDLFNLIADGGKYPKSWETSIIFPIYKNKGNKNSPDNYRGISLTPVFSKVYTTVLCNRLQVWTEKHNKLSIFQAGFRKKCRTTDQIFALHTMISKQLREKGGKLYVAFIDFQKAFDSINREALWYKLYVKGLSVKMIRIIQSIYNNVSFCIQCGDGSLTNCHNSKLGVKQGCIISPLLFNLFIDDLIIELNNADTDAPLIDDTSIAGLLYADDLAICSQSINGLQTGLDVLESYTNKWKMTVNINKSKIMVFKNGYVFSKSEIWHYKDMEIEKVKQFIYLGIKLHMDGKWNKHVELTKVRSKRAMSQVRKIISIVPTMPFLLAEKLYYTLIQSTMTYGAEMWGLSNLDILKPVQLDFFKGILGVARCTSNCGTLREIGSGSGTVECKIRAIKYWLTTIKSNKDRLPYKCITDLNSRQGESKNTWLDNIRDELCKIGMQWVWLAGENNAMGVWRKVKNRLKDIERQSIEEECRNKTSLSFQNLYKTSWGKENYLIDVGIKERAGLAWFRLGGWLQFTLKNDLDLNICPLCYKIEDCFHILFECKYTANIRDKYILKLTQDCYFRDRTEYLDLLKNIFQDRSVQTVNLGIYLSEVRELRTNQLYSILP